MRARLIPNFSRGKYSLAVWHKDENSPWIGRGAYSGGGWYTTDRLTTAGQYTEKGDAHAELGVSIVDLSLRPGARIAHSDDLYRNGVQVNQTHYLAKLPFDILRVAGPRPNEH